MVLKMILKSFGGFALMVAGLSYASGGPSFGGFSREVARPPSEVLDALAGLDITAQPGSPGTDPSRSGGIQPVFLLERGPDRMIWIVMSGDQVAVRMTAIVEPTEGGRHSRVTAEVERGDAPDDLVSPAFRSTGITKALFGMALEGELNKLTAPAFVDQARCDSLMADFETGNMAAGFAERPENLQQAVGNTAKIAIRLHALEAELRRNGCPTEQSRDFSQVSDEMSKGSGGRQGSMADIPVEGVSFKPGQPMVDPTPMKIRN